MIEYEEVIKRFTAAKANKQLWESHLKECYRYAMPQRNTIDDYSPGQKKREFVFDSTAEDSLEDFATRMESELVPPNINWMKLEAGVETPPEEQDQITEYLEQTTDTVFNHINSSNFSSQIHEAFLDLGISTGAVIVEAGDGIQSALNFRCVSLSELYLEKSSRGIVRTVFRELKIPVGDITSIWAKAKLTEKLSQMIEKDPATEATFIECCVENKQGNDFFNLVIYPEDKAFLVQETLEASPWVIFRESTIPGEVYGRGRVMRALPDIKTLNLMVKDHLTAAAFTANPIYTATDDGVINPYTIRLRPGTVIPVGSNDNTNPTLRPLPIAGDYSVLQYDIRALQDNIRRIMISKPFGNVEETPVRTATEMSIRNADMAKTSLGASGRIQNELLESIVARCVYVLKKAGKIADFKVDGKQVAIKFTSPSSRSQDEQTLAAIGRFLEIMAVFPPEMVNNEMRMEKFPTEVADILGLPASLKRSDAEKQQRAEQQAEARAEQQAIAAASVQQQQGAK